MALSHPLTTYILAGNYREYQTYMRANPGLFPATHAYLQSARDLTTIHSPKVIRIGTWYRRSDLPEITKELQIRNAAVEDQPWQGTV